MRRSAATDAKHGPRLAAQNGAALAAGLAPAAAAGSPAAAAAAADAAGAGGAALREYALSLLAHEKLYPLVDLASRLAALASTRGGLAAARFTPGLAPSDARAALAPASGGALARRVAALRARAAKHAGPTGAAFAAAAAGAAEARLEAAADALAGAAAAAYGGGGDAAAAAADVAAAVRQLRRERDHA